jgi:DeoR/GlpR family transcriptional regulator of sugar metabolism
MLHLERQHKILDLLRQRKFMNVHELARLLFASESTIRRDLAILENAGLLRRTFGGAALIEGLNAEIPLSVREDKLSREKEAIARLASTLLKSGNTVIIDSSSTAFKLIPYVPTRRVTVLTNSPKAAIELAKYPDVKVYSTGGRLRENSLSYVGRIAKNAVSLFNMDVMFFSCVGISLAGGLTDTNEDEAELKGVMMSHSRLKVALMDASKFGLVTFSRISGLSGIDCLITDKDPGPKWHQALLEAGVTLLFPEINLKK